VIQTRIPDLQIVDCVLITVPKVDQGQSVKFDLHDKTTITLSGCDILYNM